MTAFEEAPESGKQVVRLIERTFIQEAVSKQKNCPKASSTADFSSKGVEPSYFRKESFQTLISALRRLGSCDLRGFRMILTDDGFGNMRCVQERGFAFDVNSRLWYIIPAKTCGHLKKSQIASGMRILARPISALSYKSIMKCYYLNPSICRTLSPFRGISTL